MSCPEGRAPLVCPLPPSSCGSTGVQMAAGDVGDLFTGRVAGGCGGGPAHSVGAAGARLHPGRQVHDPARGHLQRQDETGLQRAPAQGAEVQRDPGEHSGLHIHIRNHRWVLRQRRLGPRRSVQLPFLLSPGLPKAAAITHAKVQALSSLFSFIGATSRDVLYTTLPLYHSAGFLGCASAIESGPPLPAQTCARLLLPLKVKRSRLCRAQVSPLCCGVSFPPPSSGTTAGSTTSPSSSTSGKSCATCATRRRHVRRDVASRRVSNLPLKRCFLPRQKLNDRSHRVRLALGNGMRPEVWREFISRFGNIHIAEFYGATEGNFFLLNYSGKIGAVGRDFYLHRVKIPQFPSHNRTKGCFVFRRCLHFFSRGIFRIL